MAIEIVTKTPCIMDPSKGDCPEGCKLKRFAIKKWLEFAMDEGVDPDLYTRVTIDDPKLLSQHRQLMSRALGMTHQSCLCGFYPDSVTTAK